MPINKKTNKFIGKQIQHYREKSGISKYDMSKSLGLSLSKYNLIERGEISIYMSLLDEVCHLLKIDLPDLMQDPSYEEHTEKTPPPNKELIAQMGILRGLMEEQRLKNQTILNQIRKTL